MDEKVRATVPDADDKPRRAEREGVLVIFLRRFPRLRLPALIGCIAAILGGGFAALGVWGYVLPAIWQWGFGPLAEGLSWHWLKALPGLLGLFFAAVLPFWLPVLPAKWALSVLALYAEDETAAQQARMQEASRQQWEIEKALEADDATGLIPLIRYSRRQLETYYEMGLHQTRKSFRYAVLAMWIGFAVIVGGLVYQLAPLERFGIVPPAAGFDWAVVAGGSVIELISALFLWVYRSAIVQLTYFYNRQMHLHNVLLSFKIARSMGTEQDAALRYIIEKILDRTWTVQRAEMPGSGGIRELFRGSGGTAA